MGICICCCCNKKETDCLENSLITFNSIETIFMILGLILIDWKIATALLLIINIFILLFSAFNLAILVVVKLLRGNGEILTTKRKLCYIFGYVCMSLSILSFFLAVLSESLISEKIYKYDRPCLYLLNETSSNSRLLAEYNETIIKENCETSIWTYFTYNMRSSYKDIVMSYLCSSIIEIFSLIGAFFWYNLVRRIKYCVEGKMNEETGLIIYGPLGGYKGKKTEKKNKLEKDGNVARNDDFLYIKKNLNVNMNMKRNRSNLSNNNSSTENNKRNKNDITKEKNEDININNQEEEYEETHQDENKNQNTQKEHYIDLDDFY